MFGLGTTSALRGTQDVKSDRGNQRTEAPTYRPHRWFRVRSRCDQRNSLRRSPPSRYNRERSAREIRMRFGSPSTQPVVPSGIPCWVDLACADEAVTQQFYGSL